jgi:hypothetical protein
LADLRSARPTILENSTVSLEGLVGFAAFMVLVPRELESPLNYRRSSSYPQVVCKFAQGFGRSAQTDGFRGESPFAIESEFTNRIIPASFGKNSWAKVVFPAPFGPAITMQRGLVCDPFTNQSRQQHRRKSSALNFLAHCVLGVDSRFKVFGLRRTIGLNLLVDSADRKC